MIVVYPMMVSNAISENTLPGIAKMLEHYIAIYMLNDVLSRVNYGRSIRHGVRYKVKKGVIVGESVDINEAEEDLPDMTQGRQPGNKNNKMDGMSDEEAEKYWDQSVNNAKKKVKEKELELKKAADDQEKKAKAERELQQAMDAEKLAAMKAKEYRDQKKFEEERNRGVKVDVDISQKVITLEPTTIKAHTEYHGTQLIGIKIVPYRVHSDAKLSHLLMHDIQVKGITAKTIPLGRKIMGMILRLTNKGPVTGDPKKDIIYGLTGHRGETFVAFEKNHDIDDYFLKNTKKINRLFKLGWGNFVICDDALQIAYFCLRATKGICQGMSYRMMYKTLGQSGVYEDLEDLRKQNSSIFKVSNKKLSKVLGESKVDEKLIKYQERQ